MLGLMQSSSYIIGMEKCSMTFSLESEKILYVALWAYLFHDLHFVYVVEEFITLN